MEAVGLAGAELTGTKDTDEDVPTDARRAPKFKRIGQDRRHTPVPMRPTNNNKPENLRRWGLGIWSVLLRGPRELTGKTASRQLVFVWRQDDGSERVRASHWRSSSDVCRPLRWNKRSLAPLLDDLLLEPQREGAGEGRCAARLLLGGSARTEAVGGVGRDRGGVGLEVVLALALPALVRSEPRELLLAVRVVLLPQA